MSLHQTYPYKSPLGIINISYTDEAITALLFASPDKKVDNDVEPVIAEQPLLQQCIQQLDDYFNGARKTFDFPMQQQGSAFQQKIWSALLDIPFGKTISYMELSKRTGDVKAIRVVGTTNGKNQLSIVVPCHRVIGSNGDLTGYSGSLWRKKWLLEHEGKFANGVQTLF